MTNSKSTQTPHEWFEKPIDQTSLDPADVAEWISQFATALQAAANETQTLEAQFVIKEEQKNKNRFRYAIAFISISTAWLIFVGFIVLAHGWGLWGFKLESTVLNFLLGTTTLNVLGPYFLIAKYLFNGNDHNKS